MKKLWKLLLPALLLLLIPFQSAEAASGNEVVDYSKKFIGVPYSFGGTSPSGFDCSGYLSYVYSHFGISLPRMSSQQATVGTTVSKAELQPGDMVFFADTYKAGVSHAGIYIGNNSFISATSSSGVKIDSMSNVYWSPKFAYGKRLSQVANGLFSDLPTSHPAYEAVELLNSKNIINGFDNGEFKPDGLVTRGQASAIVNRILKVSTSSTKSFPDVGTGSTFAKDIAAMKETGIIQGFPDGSFRPGDSLTRAQMAVILDRAFKTENKVGVTKASNVYLDVAPTSWAADAISALYYLDKTTMFKTDYFRAGFNATRAEFSAAVYNSKF
ncbi:C40 family peptidase [Falsibacillus pallidus]|uniref:S-layer family protein n=1 Tax=Falsibacillus pallidus TaxID=493781 RepID=A0A370G9W3_9BACI|nr:C40 family peptidase [Falsibacillus pallidus]RDI39980.1 S-layer family protein [Falsibacillus pallidus]